MSVYEDFCPYHYILRENSAAASFNEHKLYDPVKVLDILADELKEDPEVLGIIKDRLAYVVLNNATHPYRGRKDIVKPFRKMMLKRLRKELKHILKEKCYSKKHKLSALWVCIWPASYRWAHAIYHKRHYKYKECQKKYRWL